MKKLKFDGKEMLSKQQMSKVIGGDYYYGECTFYDRNGMIMFIGGGMDYTGGHDVQCAADFACWANPNCSNVDCAGSAECG